MSQTLHGTTIAFATSGFTASVTRINGTSMSRGAVEDTDLSTTGQMTFIPADLVDAGEFGLEFHWDQSFSTFPPISAAAETVTISFPLKSGESTKATLAGSGFVTAAKGGDAIAGQTDTAKGTMTVKWDGKTDAAYTAGS